jgi:hypothetical protein
MTSDEIADCFVLCVNLEVNSGNNFLFTQFIAEFQCKSRVAYEVLPSAVHFPYVRYCFVIGNPHCSKMLFIRTSVWTATVLVLCTLE